MQEMNMLQKNYPDLTVQKDVPLSGYTTLRVGGKADYLLTAETEETICGVLRFLQEKGIPYLLMGNGSNLLVKDGGFRGAVLRFGKEFGAIAKTDDGLYAQCGALMSLLSKAALDYGYTGLEFAHGIPGTVGGGVYMNAGAYGGEIKNTIASVRSIDKKKGIPEETPLNELEFSYRNTSFMKNERIVTAAYFRLTKGDPTEIKAKMDELMAKRKHSQPLEYPSAGSTFKRPPVGYAAAHIDECGLKGTAVGGAMVSPKHAGFVINTGEATFSDVTGLMDIIKETVLKEHGVLLEPEVEILKD